MLGFLFVTLSALAGPAEDHPVGATQALAEASRIRRSSFGTKGEQKYEILKQAAAAYEKVAADHANNKPVLAEAWFRAGEIHRTLRQVEEAERCFTQSTRVKDIPAFAARALNELGHLRRRVKDYEGAMAIYRTVADQFPGERQEGVRAMTWEGKVLLAMDEVKAGHERLLAVEDRYPDFPVDAIRNIDRVAVDWIGAGRKDDARALVDRCLEKYGAIATSNQPSAKEVARVLGKMRAREKLNVHTGPPAPPIGKGL